MYLAYKREMRAIDTSKMFYVLLYILSIALLLLP